jgi:hypothetical protein
VSPRGKLALRIIGFALGAMAFLAFVLRLILKVREGRSLETYRSGTLIEWSYGSALVTLIVLGAAALIAGLWRAVHSYRERRELSRLAALNHAESDS